MAYLVSDCVNEVRGILQDRDSTSYRYTDADLVDYFNSCIGAIALHRPDLFSTIGTIALTVDSSIQTAPAGAIRLMEIFNVNAGRVVKECDHDDLDTYDLNWHVAASGPTENWIRHPRDPLKFFVYPPPDAATVAAGLRGQYCASPTILAITGALPIADAFKPLIVEYMVWRSEARDDEYVSSPRAVLFLEAFKSNLGVSAKTKATADSDVGNRDQQRALAAQQQGAPATGNPQASQSAAIANSREF